MKKLMLFAMFGVFAGTLVFSPSADAAKYNISKGPNKTKRVVLTYDDCPDSVAQYKRVIKWAKNHNVGLVIAPTGDCVRSIKRTHGVNIAKYARIRGQYVINHSSSHADLTRLSTIGIRYQIKKGVSSNYVRPPYGAYNNKVHSVLSGMNKRIWNWTVDTNDWRGRSRSQVVNYVVNSSRQGDTVLMHLQHNGFSVKAVKQMKSGLAKKNLKICRPYKVNGKITRTPTALPNRIPC